MDKLSSAADLNILKIDFMDPHFMNGQAYGQRFVQEHFTEFNVNPLLWNIDKLFRLTLDAYKLKDNFMPAKDASRIMNQYKKGFTLYVRQLQKTEIVSPSDPFSVPRTGGGASSAAAPKARTDGKKGKIPSREGDLQRGGEVAKRYYQDTSYCSSIVEAFNDRSKLRDVFFVVSKDINLPFEFCENRIGPDGKPQKQINVMRYEVCLQGFISKMVELFTKDKKRFAGLSMTVEQQAKSLEDEFKAEKPAAPAPQKLGKSRRRKRRNRGASVPAPAASGERKSKAADPTTKPKPSEQLAASNKPVELTPEEAAAKEVERVETEAAVIVAEEDDKRRRYADRKIVKFAKEVHAVIADGISESSLNSLRGRVIKEEGKVARMQAYFDKLGDAEAREKSEKGLVVAKATLTKFQEAYIEAKTDYEEKYLEELKIPVMSLLIRLELTDKACEAVSFDGRYTKKQIQMLMICVQYMLNIGLFNDRLPLAAQEVIARGLQFHYPNNEYTPPLLFDQLIAGTLAVQDVLEAAGF